MATRKVRTGITAAERREESGKEGVRRISERLLRGRWPMRQRSREEVKWGQIFQTIRFPVSLFSGKTATASPDFALVVAANAGNVAVGGSNSTSNAAPIARRSGAMPGGGPNGPKPGELRGAVDCVGARAQWPWEERTRHEAKRRSVLGSTGHAGGRCSVSLPPQQLLATSCHCQPPAPRAPGCLSAEGTL